MQIRLHTLNVQQYSLNHIGYSSNRWLCALTNLLTLKCGTRTTWWAHMSVSWWGRVRHFVSNCFWALTCCDSSRLPQINGTPKDNKHTTFAAQWVHGFIVPPFLGHTLKLFRRSSKIWIRTQNWPPRILQTRTHQKIQHGRQTAPNVGQEPGKLNLNLILLARAILGIWHKTNECPIQRTTKYRNGSQGFQHVIFRPPRLEILESNMLSDNMLSRLLTYQRQSLGLRGLRLYIVNEERNGRYSSMQNAHCTRTVLPPVQWDKCKYIYIYIYIYIYGSGSISSPWVKKYTFYV